MMEQPLVTTISSELEQKLQTAVISLSSHKENGHATISIKVGTEEVICKPDIEAVLRAALVRQLRTDGVKATMAVDGRVKTVLFKLQPELDEDPGEKGTRLVILILDENDSKIGYTSAHLTEDHQHATELEKYYSRLGRDQNASNQAELETQVSYQSLGIMKLAFSLLCEQLIALGTKTVTGTINQVNTASVNARTKAPALLKGGFYPTNVALGDMTNLVLTSDLTRITTQPWDYKAPQHKPL